MSSGLITVSGAVLSSMPVGEYDRRIVLLTREKGKIPVFAKGARKPGSAVMAASTPFVFGNYSLYEGRQSYTLTQAEITHQFVDLSSRQPEIYYGYYFLELADYFGREGSDGKEMLNLLFVTAKTLLSQDCNPRLVRCIFELRTLTMEGMMPELFCCTSCGRETETGERVWFSQNAHGILCEKCRRLDPYAAGISSSARYAMQYMEHAPLRSLYSFRVTEEVLLELEQVIHRYTGLNTDRRFKSLQILEMMDA